jgi:signal transduction histidine kinase
MKMAVDLLSKEGYTVFSESNLFKVVAMIVEKKIDMIIVDIDDIGSKEMQFFDTAREINPGIRILVSFSIENRDKAAKALEQGAGSYILKPLSLSELHSVVQRWAQLERGVNPRPKSTDPAFIPAEQEFQQSLERLATRIAHEINNPLTTVSGHLQMLLADAREKNQDCRVYAIMEEEAQRIADLVKNLLTLAQPLDFDQTPVDLNSLLKEVLTPLAKDELNQGLIVAQNLQKDLPKINANRQQLKLSCKNIIDNSKRSMHGKGKLEVTTKAQDSDLVQVSFKDTSPGLSSKVLSHVFDPFYAVNNGGEETDLGLCVSYRIVKNHGGTLAVDSKEGKGTTFTISLPINNNSQCSRSICDV